ncbi:uncharacterized protein [Fopius arisanus]|uniref:Odorant receptor n=1 Tax=Fopius arisanus TaxID=64838 RepID=A0A9R1TE80_9HYME|nr:PREDICTED: uncharacterized protein LOC105269299 [Fopius arisanus]
MKENSELMKYNLLTSSIKFWMLFVGIWPIPNPPIAYRALPIFIVSGNVFLSIALFRFAIAHISNMQLMVKGVSLGMSFITIAFKVIIFTLCRDKIIDLLGVVKNYHEDSLADENLGQLALKGMSGFRRSSLLLFFLIACGAVSYCIAPIIFIAIQLGHHLQTIHYILPLPALYPWEIRPGGILYQVTYVFEVCNLMSLLFTSCGVDSLFGYYILLINGQLRVMGYQLKHLSGNNVCHAFIPRFVDKYIVLQQCCDGLQRIYGPVILWQEALSAPKYLLIMGYSGSKILQTYLYASAGSNLTAESEALMESIYCSDWQETGRRFRTSILVMLTQKPVRITAAHCIIVSNDMLIMTLNTAVSQVKGCLYPVGLWPSEKPKLWYRLLPYAQLFLSAITVVAIMNYLVHHIRNWNIVIRVISLLASTSLYIFKLSQLMIHRREILDISKILNDYSSRIINEERSLNFAWEWVKVCLTCGRSIIIMVYGSFFVLLVIIPAVVIFIQEMGHTENIKYTLVYPTMYPWDTSTNGVAYRITYLLESLTALSCCHVTSGVDNLYLFWIFQTTGQLRAMSYRLHHIRDGDNYDDILKDNIIQYGTLMRIRNQLENIYGPIIIFCNGSAAVLLCTLIFQLSKASSLTKIQIARFTLYAFGKIFQVYLFTWPGTFLAAESENYLRSVYLSDWINHPSCTSFVMTTLAQKPLTMKACHVSVVSVEMFAKMIQTTVSYSLLLKTVAPESCCCLFVVCTQGTSIRIIDESSMLFVQVLCLAVNVKKIMWFYNTVDDLCNQFLSDERFHKFVLNDVTIYRYFFWFHTSLCGFSGTIPLVMSMVSVMNQKIHDVHPIKYNLIIPGMYPWNASINEIVYGFHFGLESYTLMWTFYVGALVDVLFSFSLLQMTIPLRGMSHAIIHLCDESDYEDTLRRCLIQYRTLIECRNIIENTYGLIILGVAITGPIALCSLAWQVTQMETISNFQKFRFAVHGVAKILQVFSYSWSATMLKGKSEDFLGQVYFSKWQGNRSLMNTVFTILIQRPLTIRAGHMPDVSLSMFVFVMKTTASYYLLLQTMEQKAS